MKYDVELIRAANPIIDIIGRYGVEMNRKGYACCPFHNEKTGSFKVYSDGTYHCFGCGAHGDVIDFVSKIEGIDFNEACSRLGGELSFSGYRAANKRKKDSEDKARRLSEAWDNYYLALEAFENNENQILRLRPRCPDDTASDMWLSALQRRAQLQYELEIAENKISKLEGRGIA